MDFRRCPPKSKVPRPAMIGHHLDDTDECKEWMKVVGERVCISGVKRGILRYFGRTNFSHGYWCGVELDEPVGKNNGSVNGVQYFNCKHDHGIFAPVGKVARLEDYTHCRQPELESENFAHNWDFFPTEQRFIKNSISDPNFQKVPSVVPTPRCSGSFSHDNRHLADRRGFQNSSSVDHRGSLPLSVKNFEMDAVSRKRSASAYVAAKHGSSRTKYGFGKKNNKAFGSNFPSQTSPAGSSHNNSSHLNEFGSTLRCDPRQRLAEYTKMSNNFFHAFQPQEYSDFEDEDPLSAEYDESLGILTPSQMKDFSLISSASIEQQPRRHTMDFPNSESFDDINDLPEDEQVHDVTIKYLGEFSHGEVTMQNNFGKFPCATIKPNEEKFFCGKSEKELPSREDFRRLSQSCRGSGEKVNNLIANTSISDHMKEVCDHHSIPQFTTEDANDQNAINCVENCLFQGKKSFSEYLSLKTEQFVKTPVEQSNIECINLKDHLKTKDVPQKSFPKESKSSQRVCDKNQTYFPTTEREERVKEKPSVSWEDHLTECNAENKEMEDSSAEAARRSESVHTTDSGRPESVCTADSDRPESVYTVDSDRPESVYTVESGDTGFQEDMTTSLDSTEDVSSSNKRLEVELLYKITESSNSTSGYSTGLSDSCCNDRNEDDLSSKPFTDSSIQDSVGPCDSEDGFSLHENNSLERDFDGFNGDLSSLDATAETVTAIARSSTSEALCETMVEDSTLTEINELLLSPEEFKPVKSNDSCNQNEPQQNNSPKNNSCNDENNKYHQQNNNDPQNNDQQNNGHQENNSDQQRNNDHQSNSDGHQQNNDSHQQNNDSHQQNNDSHQQNNDGHQQNNNNSHQQNNGGHSDDRRSPNSNSRQPNPNSHPKNLSKEASEEVDSRNEDKSESSVNFTSSTNSTPDKKSTQKNQHSSRNIVEENKQMFKVPKKGAVMSRIKAMIDATSCKNVKTAEQQEAKQRPPSQPKKGRWDAVTSKIAASMAEDKTKSKREVKSRVNTNLMAAKNSAPRSPRLDSGRLSNFRDRSVSPVSVSSRDTRPFENKNCTNSQKESRFIRSSKGSVQRSKSPRLTTSSRAESPVAASESSLTSNSFNSRTKIPHFKGSNSTIASSIPPLPPPIAPIKRQTPVVPAKSLAQNAKTTPQTAVSKAKKPATVPKIRVSPAVTTSSQSAQSKKTAKEQGRATRPAPWLSKAELGNEIQRLGSLCEARTKELNRLRLETRHVALGFDAISALFKYTVEDLKVFSVPSLNQDLKKTLKQLELAKQDLAYYETEVEEMKAHHCQELNDLSNKLFEVYQGEITELSSKHQEELNYLQSDHQKQINNLSSNFNASAEVSQVKHEEMVESLKQELIAQREELQLLQERELQDLEERHAQSERSVQQQLDTLQQKCAEFQRHAQSMEEAMHKDTDTKLQLVASRKSDLEKEVESLKTVLEIRNKDLHSLRVQNLEMEKQLEDLPVARERIKMLQAKAEDLQALMREKTKLERRLTNENCEMRDFYERETKVNKRLSMENEELQWRLRHVERSITSSFTEESVQESPDDPRWSGPESAKSQSSHSIGNSVFFTFTDQKDAATSKVPYQKITPNFFSGYRASRSYSSPPDTQSANVTPQKVSKKRAVKHHLQKSNDSISSPIRLMTSSLNSETSARYLDETVESELKIAEKMSQSTESIGKKSVSNGLLNTGALPSSNQDPEKKKIDLSQGNCDSEQNNSDMQRSTEFSDPKTYYQMTFSDTKDSSPENGNRNSNLAEGGGAKAHSTSNDVKARLGSANNVPRTECLMQNVNKVASDLGNANSE